MKMQKKATGITAVKHKERMYVLVRVWRNGVLCAVSENVKWVDWKIIKLKWKL